VTEHRTYSVSESLGLLSIVRNSKLLENTTFRKLDLFPSSGERNQTPSLLAPLERANFKHWIKFANPIILSVIHPRQNPLDSVYIVSLSLIDESLSNKCLFVINEELGPVGNVKSDRLFGLAVRVPGSIPGATRFSVK
jgi:hypothetical protein